MKYLDFKHLKHTKTSYFTHLFYATKLNILALLVFITGTIHSFIPILFPYTPYKLAKKIVDVTEEKFGKPLD